MNTMQSDWIISDNKLRREFEFEDFKETMAFVNKVANLAEEMNHHPDMHISYKKLVLELWSHDVNAVSERDRALAARIDQLLEE